MKKLLASRSGATAIEYGLIACFIALVIVASIGAVGAQVGNLFGAVANGFSGS